MRPRGAPTEAPLTVRRAPADNSIDGLVAAGPIRPEAPLTSVARPGRTRAGRVAVSDPETNQPRFPDRPVRHFGGWRPLWEALQDLATPFRWPVRLTDAIGWRSPVSLSLHVVTAPPGTLTRTVRLAFAADFHAGPTTSTQSLVEAASLLAAVEPDVLLYGGDFVSPTARHLPDLTAILRDSSAPGGSYAVLGNHDHYAGGRRVARDLETVGVRVLLNESVDLPRALGALSIVGLDDHMTGYPDADAAFAAAGAARVLLIHQPSGLLDAGDHPYSLALAGHTHGGQIATRAGWRPVLPHGPLSRVHPAGEYGLGDGRHLIVSRGVGCTTLPIRINAPPEVHLIEMRPAQP